ncbi:MAG: adenylyltransferase/cytidyltransferase family protein [Candidatus Njordarchaeia archaeon]
MSKTVMVAGSFDILHLGHINFFKMAKSLCENCKLIVVVARDSTIKKIKGRQPVFSEKERLELVKSIKYVDEAILGNEVDEGSLFDIIKRIKPDIIALGYDQAVDIGVLKKWCKENNINVEIVRLNKFEVANGINSSSQVREKILRLYGNKAT